MTTAGVPVLDLLIEGLWTVERSILARIEWCIERSEHWAVVGPNGAGKTTLVRVLAAELWPSRGHVAVLGERFGAADLRELRERIAIVSTAVDDRVVRWDPEGFEHLSQGERQTELIARALARKPALLLLDEPCAGLDPVARERFLADLGPLVARPGGPSLVLVTHHVEEIPPFVTHLLALREGRVTACGPIEAALTSESMSDTFGVPCRVERDGRTWRLLVAR